MRFVRTDLNWTRAWLVILLWIAVATSLPAQTITTTTVQGTVYLANGAPGSGTLQVSWPSFTTASNQAVAAGKLTVNIGADGFVSLNLAPNLGSSPAGLYYTAIYHLSDGTTNSEYWVIPAAAQASIGQVRAQVMPAAQAVQAVTKTYVDQAIQSVAQGNLTSTGGQLTGPLYLTGDPTQALQAADKHYVDSAVAQSLPLAGGTATGPITAKQLGAAYQVDQFGGADFGAKLQGCLSVLNGSYGGTCDARNFSGNVSMSTNVTVATANATVLLPCATISTANRIVVTAGTRNVSLRGCSLRGASNASGSQGGTVLLYSGPGAAVQVGDLTYAADTLGFHLDNVLINTTASSSSSTQAIAAYRTQEMDLESLYLLGNANQTGITLDGTGNYTGGTFYDNHISGFQTAVNGIGHQVTNSAATDWMNASTFVRLHINCPTTNGNPIAGTYGINLQQGDGNSFTGGDVEGCATALHLGANAQNNTIVGLRNENSTYQVIADAGSSYNSWMTGGTMYTGKLSDNGTRNSFLDSFHRSFNSLNGDWYGSQQDATVTNHFRLGIGGGNERGMLDRYQTDFGYRWTMGLSDATGGEQFYQVLDELNNVYRISVGQYNNGQASTNNQTVINAAGTGAVVLNGSNNSGTGGVVFGSGGPNESTVATISNTGNAQFNGTVQVGGTTQSAGTMTVRNNADAEVDYYLWPGMTASQKGSFTYKDYNGSSQWYMVKDANNNWALNSAIGGLDSFKAYQSTNSGDTYINASNTSGVVRVNYEAGSGNAFNIYGGGSGILYASFSGSNSIKFPGLSASSGRNCLQIDSSGYISNTGSACGSGSGSGTVNSGSTGQIAYYSGNGAAVSGMSTIPISAGGTGAGTAAAALAALGGASLIASTQQNFAGPINAIVNSQLNVMSYGAKGDCLTDDTGAFDQAQTAAQGFAVGNSLPGVLFLPKPPGGCYIVSNWTWKGVSLEGQPTGLGPSSPATYGVTLKSKPGQDILHVPDVTTASGTVKLSAGWSIRNIGFLVDNSAAGSFPHRWPGRWFDDGVMTAGSAIFKTTSGSVTCGDTGQAILVSGAGPGGSSLITTIQSVAPCWQTSTSGWQVITLAVPASTTVTNAHTYISVLGLPVTQNVGNCAIAADMMDGKQSDWTGTLKTGNYGKLENVAFQVTAGMANYSCGIYTQGNPLLYGLDARNFAFYGSYFGVIQGTTELNSVLQSSSGDFEKWDHGAFLFGGNPWISYNGLSQKLTHIELTARSGFQILNVAATSGDTASGWEIDHGFECPYGDCTQYGDHIVGSFHTITSALTSTGPGMHAFLDANSSTCNHCTLTNTQVDGFGNTISATDAGSTGMTNMGLGNVITSTYSPNPFSGIPIAYRNSMTPYKGSNVIANRYTADFLFDNNYTTAYNHDDLFIWPTDVIFGSSTPWSTYVMTDATSPSGYNLQLTANTTFTTFNQFAARGNTGNSIVVGTTIPATGATLYLMAKCPDGTTTFKPFIGVQGGTGNGPSFSCTTNYGYYAVPIIWSAGDIGKGVKIGAAFSSNTFYAAWFAVVPNTGKYNGYTPQIADGSVTYTAMNWQFGGSTTSPDPSSPVGFSTNESNAQSLSAANGSNNLLGGFLYPAAPSTISYTVGAPSVWTNTLNGAITNAATSISLGSGTTSVWANGGCFLIDQEVMCYSGTPAVGTTSLTVTRGQAGTIAQSHSNGAAINSVGTGLLAVNCNGATQSAVNVYYAPTMQVFSAQFPGQNCSGYATQAALLQYANGPTGQQYNIAQITIRQDGTKLNAPTAARQLPMSANYQGGYSYSSNVALAGSGSGVTTGPTSGTTANHVATFSGANGQIQDGGVGMPLSATSGSIGGSALSAGQCASGTVPVSGAATSMAVAVSPAAGTSPGTGFVWQGYVNSPGSVTVQVCAIAGGTPTATTYNVRVIQ